MRAPRLQMIRLVAGSACLLPTLLLAGPTCDDADAPALALLEKLSRSGLSVGHHGMATLQRGGDMRVLRIQRSTANDGVTDSLTLLTGQSARVVRAGHPETCTHPGHNLLRPTPGDGGACGVSAYYRLSLETGDRVAGRATRRIIAQPRDMYRYAHVLEIDAQTSQLLKVTTLTADGRPLEQFQYASLALEAGPVDGDAELSEAAGARAAHPAGHPDTGDDASVGEAGPIRWQPEWVPDGFVSTRGRPAGDRQTYTDGITSFSVFLEPVATAMQPGEGAVREGSTLSYTRGMQLAGTQVLVTVVGEIPVNTARIVADSVALR